MTRAIAGLSAAFLAGMLIVTSGCRSSASSSLPLQNQAATQAAKAQEPEHFAQRSTPEKPSPLTKPLVAPAGTPIQVRLNGSLDTARSRPGERFTAVLAAPIVVDGETLVPSGANVEGVVRNAASSGRLKGRADLSIALDSMQIGGSSVPLVTDTVDRTSGGHKRRNLTLIGGGSGLGALIGGLAGGGRGALIGAGAGAGAGTAGAAFTGRKQVHIPAESILIFHLRQPLQIRG